MSPHDWTLRVEDILQAIGRITQHIAGMTEDWSSDKAIYRIHQQTAAVWRVVTFGI